MGLKIVPNDITKPITSPIKIIQENPELFTFYINLGWYPMCNAICVNPHFEFTNDDSNTFTLPPVPNKNIDGNGRNMGGSFLDVPITSNICGSNGCLDLRQVDNLIEWLTNGNLNATNTIKIGADNPDQWIFSQSKDNNLTLSKKLVNLVQSSSEGTDHPTGHNPLLSLTEYQLYK
jgi:hypothetical protein